MTEHAPPIRLIALTGGIATGKSTVAALLTARGAQLVDADQIARQVVAPGQPALAEIEKRFSHSVIDNHGRLDRVALGAVIFADSRARHDLEAITHPRILEAMARQIAIDLASDAPLVVVDIPLFYESHHEATFPDVLLVYCDPATQLQRLLARDSLTPRAAQQRLDAQLPIEGKRARATWVVDNSGDPASTRSQVAQWWRTNIGAQLEHG